MRKLFILALMVFFAIGASGMALAADLADNEKAVHKTFADLVPADKMIGVEQFFKVYNEVMEGKRKAYLIDVRSHPEFYAFHIEGTDHVHAGHMYTIPKLIKDPNAEIYIFCRTKHRALYVTGFLYKYGYKNVYCFTDGVVGWAAAGHPFVNQFTGSFKIFEYRKSPSEKEKSYRIREFHPY